MVKTVFSALAVALVVCSLCDARPASSRQLLPPMPGYVPVYIRNGDTPLEDINVELAEAFHAIHSGRSAGRTSIEALEEDPRNDVALIKKNRAASLSAPRSATSLPKDTTNKNIAKKGTEKPQNEQKVNVDKQITETKEKSGKENQVHEKKGRAPESLDDISVVDAVEDKRQTDKKPSQVAVKILEKVDTSANIQRIPKL